MSPALPDALDIVLLRAVIETATALAAGHTEGLNWAVRSVMQVDALKMGVPTLLAMYVWLRPQGGYRTDPGRALRGAAGVILTLAMARAAQLLLPARPRPRVALADIHFAPLGPLPDLADWSSIPSDHAALAFALSAVAWAGSRRLGALAAAWSLGAICLPRIYLGYHYPSDILAGAALGCLCVTLALWLPLGEGPGRLARAWVGQLNARAPTLLLLGFFLLGAECLHMFHSTRRFAVVVAEGVHALTGPAPATATAAAPPAGVNPAGRRAIVAERKGQPTPQ